MSEKALQRRRSTVRRLHQKEGLGVREIARRTGIPASNVSRDLRAAKPDGGPGSPPAGNGRALRHGATSELALAPVRRQIGDDLRRDFPWADERRLVLLADVLARTSNGIAWLDRVGRVVVDADLNTYPLVERLDKWEGRAFRMLQDLEAEALQRRDGGAGGALDAHLAANYGSDEGADGDGGALVAAGDGGAS